ncbi:MAG: pitrilysin family protein [Thermoanaerobaculia bacterium]
MKQLPPEPGPAVPFFPPPFVHHALSSGLEVRAARWGKRPTVAVSLLFPGAGSVADQSGREGTSEITAESMLGGTSRKSSRELAEAIDDLAAVVDVAAGFDSAVARLFILEKDLEQGLDLLAEVLGEASFPEDEIEKNRRRQIDLIKEQRSEPDFLARERLLDRLYPGHPYGTLTATEAGLLAITRDDVLGHYRTRFSLQGATLILVGAAEPGRLIAAAERTFGRTSLGIATRDGAIEPPPLVKGFSIHLVNRPGSVQTNLLFARPAIKRNDPRFAAAIVANQSLGGGASSRLFHVLREERSLTYGAYSSLTPRVHAGHFGASIDCRTDVTDAALSGLLGLIKEFAAEGPSEAEHLRSQNFLRGSFALARETPGAIAQDETTRILHQLPQDEFLTWRERVGAVSTTDAREAAATLFDPSQGVLAAVGDASAIRATLEKYGETTLWDADGPVLQAK